MQIQEKVKIRNAIPRFHASDGRKQNRSRHFANLRRLLKQSPVVAVLGARQVGKTTLARELVRATNAGGTLFDLEDEIDRSRLTDPMMALAGLKGLVVLDEIQRKQDLFLTLRVLADRERKLCRFLVLGSASPELLKQSSETLAGRIAHYPIAGFALDEVGEDKLERLWLRGGFPRAFLARSEKESVRWRRDFVRTFIERDLPQLGIKTPADTLGRFWKMLAHYHGQVWNASEFGRALGANDKTARNYLDLLCGTYVIKRLQPWHENLKKRQVKSPKVYISDSGLLHTLLGIPTLDDLHGHPKVGASWEGFMLDQIVTRLGAEPDELYFWSVHAGPELDLLIVRGKRRIGFEFKLTVAPKVTKSMHVAYDLLGLSKLYVVHAGEESFTLGKNIQALAAKRIWSDLPKLK